MNDPAVFWTEALGVLEALERRVWDTPGITASAPAAFTLGAVTAEILTLRARLQAEAAAARARTAKPEAPAQ